MRCRACRGPAPELTPDAIERLDAINRELADHREPMLTAGECTLCSACYRAHRAQLYKNDVFAIRQRAQTANTAPKAISSRMKAWNDLDD